jgi:hypothetical protein
MEVLVKDYINVICGTVLLVTILVGVFALAWHGTLDGAVTAGILTAVIGIAGGAFAVQQGVKAGSEAANTIPTAVVHKLDTST